LSYARLNRIVRVFLVACAALTLLFFVLSARPTPRFRGTILGRVGQDIPLYNDEDQGVMLVRLDNPAVVSFPGDWEKGDEFCGVYTFRRGNPRTGKTFEGELAQSLWDQRNDSDIVIGFNSIVARAPETYPITPGDRTILDLIRQKLGYSIIWFDETDPIYLPKGQDVSRLLCYHFLAPDGSPRLPEVHVIRFNPRNAQTTRRGGFYIRYNSPITPDDPPEAIKVERLSIGDYLRRLEDSGTTVVVKRN